MPTDLELLQRWREGDRGAGEDLLGRHFDSLVGFFHYKLDDGVEDLIQATMLACVEGRDRIEHGSFRAYLFGVARRMLYQHFRRRRAHDHVDFGSCSVRDLGPSPSTAFRRAESRELMIEALRQVPIDFQIALELHYFEGLASPEIAAVLEIETTTVRTRLHRGRKLLRAAFDRLSADPERATAMMARLEASRDGTASRP